MRIVFRHSSGRGEYEVSGEASGYTSTDLIDKHVTIVLSPDWRIRTGLVNRSAEGKKRLRSEPKGAYIGVQRQICTALLLTPTVRSQSGVDTGGQLFEFVEADRVDLVGGEALFYASNIQVSDSTAVANINVERRVREVKELWDRARELPQYISELVEQHRAEVTSGEPISKATEKLYKSIPRFLASADAEAEELVQGAGDLLPGLQSLTSAPVSRPIFDVDLIPVQEVEVKRRAIDAWRKWQLTNVRGPSGRRFSRGVRMAYDSTCLVCGVRLPGGGAGEGRSPGVDAAHILPWRDYEADDIYNGICLCKNHHWAFDSGLLGIEGDERSNDYIVYVPEKARTSLLALGDQNTLTWLESFVGVIPVSRLPVDPLHHPRREFFQILARQMQQ